MSHIFKMLRKIIGGKSVVFLFGHFLNAIEGLLRYSTSCLPTTSNAPTSFLLTKVYSNFNKKNAVLLFGTEKMF